MAQSREIDKKERTGLERARKLFREKSVVRSQDFDAQGIGREYLRLLVEGGEIMRLSRGFYMAADAPLSTHHALALCARRVPEGVVCLLSALLFHELGTALPWQVWLAVGVKAHKPRLDSPPLRLVRFSTLALHEGVVTHTIEDVPVKITSPARTVVDCFRYRHKVGLDVALEALRASLLPRRDEAGHTLPPLCTRAEIGQFAKTLRAMNVMRPYLEAYSAF